MQSVVRWFRVGVMLAASISAQPLARGVTFQFTFVDDDALTFESRGWLDPESLFQRNLRSAAHRWGAQFDSTANIIVRVDTTSFAARAGGAFSFGRYLGNTSEGKQLWETGPLTRILTGDNPGEDFLGYDIVLGFDAEFVESNYWFDPNPNSRSEPVPPDRGDFVSVVLHELGHGLGIAGNRDFATSTITGDVVSQFDERSYFGGEGNPFDTEGNPNPLYFSGPMATSLFGGGVPLTHSAADHPSYSQNFYHLSACDGSDGLAGTLMNGCVLPNGERLTITPLDAALLIDLGYPPADLSATDFNSDGAIDSLDLHEWQQAYAINDAADADGDGDSDGRDFLIWQRHYGSGVPVAQRMIAPEPPSMEVFVAAAFGLFGFRGAAKR